MSILDDARRLMAFADIPTECAFCGGKDDVGNYKHVTDCPWLSLSRIVAVLEAAERVTQDDPFILTWDHDGSYYNCWECDAPRGTYHEPDCLWQSLVAAMRGEEIGA